MLFPRMNRYRSKWECPGLWNFKADPQNVGESERWFEGFSPAAEIAIPGSWNEQLEELGLLNYVGKAWCSCSMFVPHVPAGQTYWLHVGSADYHANVWVNGAYVGEHTGGFISFDLPLTGVLKAGETNDIVICINNTLDAETIPQGITAEDYQREERLREETFPPARFDFFPYGGIHRPVSIVTLPEAYIRDIKIDTVVESPEKGTVNVVIRTTNAADASLRMFVESNGRVVSQSETLAVEDVARVSVKMDPCRLWSPDDPHLYTLRVVLILENREVDEYALQFGVRQVTISDGKLLLNGRPVYLKGFGKHEDFPVLGKALSLPLVVKDFQLMKWIHANSFRTSHYPYADEVMDMADRGGFLVIDEVPAVSLDMRTATVHTLDAHKKAVEELIARDYNHPSVIMWALGNEPNIVGERGYYLGSGRKYWNEIFSHARSLDSTRPLTVPNCTRAGIEDPVFEFSDVMAINRYYGWYEYPGRIDQAIAVLEREMDELHRRYKKPMMMTEFGVDTMPGLHSTSDQMFTEEYQQTFLKRYIQLLRSKSYVVAEHVWNFADFRTPQHFRRVFLNLKGVFTRTREPKAAAFLLKQLWSSPSRFS